MTLRFWQQPTLAAAVVTTGLMAGLFFAFATGVMPALRRSDDRTFSEAMTKINVDIVNGWFLLCFLGGLALSVLAALLHLTPGGRAALPWIITGAVLYLAVIVITGTINVPLNNELAKTGHTASLTELATARQHFQNRWVAWNTARTLLTVASFACLVVALTLSARHAATPTADLKTTGVAGAGLHPPGNGADRARPSTVVAVPHDVAWSIAPSEPMFMGDTAAPPTGLPGP